MNRVKHSHVFRILIWGIAIFGSLLMLGVNVLHGDLNLDEGWYLYGARLVFHGQIPYRDFAFTQGPVMAYVYAIATPLVDTYGLIVGRFMSACFAVVALIFAVLLAMRLAPVKKKSLAGLLVLVLVGLNVYQSYFFSIVKTYSLTSALMMIGLFFLSFLNSRNNLISVFLSACFLVLASAVRVTAGAIPVVVFLWLFVRAVREKNDSIRFVVPVVFAIGGLLAACVAFGPFVLTSLDNMIFCMIRYHAGRDVGEGVSVLLLKCGSISRLIGVYFPAFILLVIVVAGLVGKYARQNLVFTDVRVQICLMLWFCVAIVGVAHLMAPFPYDDYQVMIYPLFAVVLSVLLSYMNLNLDYGRTTLILLVVLCVSLGGAISSPIAQGWVVRGKDRLWILRRDQTPLQKLRETGVYIKKQAGASKNLLTQDIYLAVESGLTVPHGMEMGQFSYFPDMTDEDAIRRNVMNKRALTHTLETFDASIAAFSGYGLSVKCPDVLELSRKEKDEFWSIVKRRYIPLKEVDNFGQAATTLKIFGIGSNYAR